MIIEQAEWTPKNEQKQAEKSKNRIAKVPCTGAYAKEWAKINNKKHWIKGNTPRDDSRRNSIPSQRI